MARSPKPPFELREGEQHVSCTHGAVLHRLGATPGRLWLTSQRVVFQPLVPWALWIIPPLGAAMYLLNRTYRRELALADIARRERASFGRNPNVMILGTRELAAKDLKVVVDDFDRFARTLSAQPAFRPLLSSGPT